MLVIAERRCSVRIADRVGQVAILRVVDRDLHNFHRTWRDGQDEQEGDPTAFHSFSS